jgi:endoglucanase
MTKITVSVTDFPLTIDFSAPSPPPPPPPPPVASGTGIKVAGGKLVDSNGTPRRLKGVNISGYEFVAIQGWDPADPLGGQVGGQYPNFATMKAWGINAIRLPFNVASLLGATTYDYNGKARNPDPGTNYKESYKKLVDDATTAGMVVIVDPHWSAPLMVIPGQANPVPFSPMTQGPAPDPITSIAAVTWLGNTFKSYPNVMIEGFNEWMLDQYGGLWDTVPPDYWGAWLNGGKAFKFPNQTMGGANFDFVQTTATTGMQQLLDALRATGAANVFIAGGIDWGSDLAGWLTHVPKDPLGQVCASTHVYPSTSYGSAGYANLNTTRLLQVQAIQAAGYPVIFGEVGGEDAAGTPSEPFTSAVLDWAVAHGVGYFGWAWNTWANGQNVLIKDAAGTPTDGFGVVFKAHA